jgi:hypothetical protein
VRSKREGSERKRFPPRLRPHTLPERKVRNWGIQGIAWHSTGNQPQPTLCPLFCLITAGNGSVAKNCIHLCVFSVFRPCCLKYQLASGVGLPQTVPVLAMKVLHLGKLLGKPGDSVPIRGEAR